MAKYLMEKQLNGQVKLEVNHDLSVLYFEVKVKYWSATAMAEIREEESSLIENPEHFQQDDELVVKD